MSGKPAEIGDLGKAVAARVKAVRQARRMTYTEVSQRLRSNGRDLNPVAVRRIEDLERRVDVDDVCALAKALDVSLPEMMGLAALRSISIAVS